MKYIPILFLILFSQCAWASSHKGKILEIRMTSKDLSFNNVTHFILEGERTDKPACAGDWWAVDTDTQTGQNFLSALMVAYTTGTEIRVWGNNLCDLHSSMESAHQIGFE